MLELIIFTVFIIGFVGVLVINVIINNKKRFLENLVAQLSMEKFSLLKELDVITSRKETKILEQSEGFLKFISDSRDWAFDYIENVQAAIEKFDQAKKLKDTAATKAAYNHLLSFLPKMEEMNKENK